MLTASERLCYVREGTPPGTQYFEPDRFGHEGFSPELRESGGESEVNELVSWTADRARKDEVRRPVPSVVQFCPRCGTQL